MLREKIKRILYDFVYISSRKFNFLETESRSEIAWRWGDGEGEGERNYTG